jgi:hypothetical protein
MGKPPEWVSANNRFATDRRRFGVRLRMSAILWWLASGLPNIYHVRQRRRTDACGHARIRDGPPVIEPTACPGFDEKWSGTVAPRRPARRAKALVWATTTSGEASEHGPTLAVATCSLSQSIAEITESSKARRRPDTRICAGLPRHHDGLRKQTPRRRQTVGTCKNVLSPRWGGHLWAPSGSAEFHSRLPVCRRHTHCAQRGPPGLAAT